MSMRDKRSLATLIYYPKQKMDMVKKTETNIEDWYRVHLYLLIEVSNGRQVNIHGQKYEKRFQKISHT